MDNIDIVIPRRRALREYLLCSPVTAWRREHTDSDWPEAVEMSPGRFGYRLSRIKSYLDSRKPIERAV